MPHHSFCAQLIASHRFYPDSFFTPVCHAVLNFAIPRRFRRVGVTVMWVPAWPAVLNCANNSPIQNRQTFTRWEVESSRRRAGRWRSPAVAAHCPPVGPSPHPTSTEAKRSRARSQSSRRRQIPPATPPPSPPHATDGSCPPPSLNVRPRNPTVLATPLSSTPLTDRRAEGAGRRRGRRGAGRGRRGAGRALE
jgi:hypothetical protein